MSDLYAALDQVVLTGGWPASRVCGALGVGRSGFYRWRSARTSPSAGRDEELMPLVREVFWRHKRRYGARRIAAELAARDVACGVGRVARLLKTLGLKALQPKSFAPKTTHSRHRLGYSPNLLEGRQNPSGPDQLWVADITYVPLRGGGFEYLAVLMDRWSRRVVGWDYDDSMRGQLVLRALAEAVRARRPAAGLIHHSDRGGQYASKAYRAALRRAGAVQSMSGAANCYDNAFMESCFGTLKTELQLVDYPNGAVALREIREYLRYYNFERRHSSLGYESPIAFEANAAATDPNPKP